MTNCPKCETHKQELAKDKITFTVGTLVYGDMTTCTKCDYKTCWRDRCSHGKEYHYEGACWFITQPIYEKDNTDEKYCICKEEGNIRLYKTKGFMTQDTNDLFITKPCAICKQPVMLLAGATTCNRCKERPENYELTNLTKFVRTTVKLNR